MLSPCPTDFEAARLEPPFRDLAVKLSPTPRVAEVLRPPASKPRASPALRVALALVAAGFPGAMVRALAAVLPPVLTPGAGTDAPAPGDQMRAHWLREVEAARERWLADFEQRTDPAAIAAHGRALQQAFRDAIGGLPERTPLHARTVGESLWAAVERGPRGRVHCIRGERSGYVDDADVARLEAAGSPVETIAGAGHFLHAERPAAVLDALIQHLE